MERMHDDRLVEEIYSSEAEGNRERKRQPASWEGKVSEYTGERTHYGVWGMGHAREMCLDKVAWRVFCHNYPPERSS